MMKSTCKRVLVLNEDLNAAAHYHFSNVDVIKFSDAWDIVDWLRDHKEQATVLFVKTPLKNEENKTLLKLIEVRWNKYHSDHSAVNIFYI